jgi:O-antigen ligase
MINTVIFSSTVPAMLSVIQLAAILWSADSGDEIFSRIDGILARTDGVAVYLLAALIFAISASRHNTGRSKAVYALAVVLNFLALIISGEIFALLALIISAFSFYVLRSNRRVWISLLLLVCVPYLILFLPNRYIDMLFLFVPSLSTADQLLSLWESCIAAIGNSPIFGIGMGAESFAAEMAKYGIEGLKNSGNLFIELGLEAGVFALISFLFVLFTRVSHRKKYFSYVRSSQVSTDSLVSEVCFFALIAYGCMNYIWSDISAYYLFWTVFGIGSATLRVAKKEHDDLVFYYKDTMAVDSSAIDVEIA